MSFSGSRTWSVHMCLTPDVGLLGPRTLNSPAVFSSPRVVFLSRPTVLPSICGGMQAGADPAFWPSSQSGRSPQQAREPGLLSVPLRALAPSMTHLLCNYQPYVRRRTSMIQGAGAKS